MNACGRPVFAHLSFELEFLVVTRSENQLFVDIAVR
jgi:hypothetical protein